MGQTGGKIARSLERAVEFLVPPACREEVTGDLHQRYRSLSQYFLEAIRTVPLVILSRIRRTSGPRLLSLYAVSQYMALVIAARLLDNPFLQQEWAFARLAIPGVLMMLGLALERAYAKQDAKLGAGQTSALTLSWAAQLLLQVTKPAWSVPTFVFLNGSALGVLPGYMIVRYFPPIPTQAKTVNAPAVWLEYDFDRWSLRALFCSMIVLAYIFVASVFGRF